jgi:hypothetical protein
MTPLKTLFLSAPVLDPGGSGQPKQTFIAGQAYILYRDAASNEFVIQSKGYEVRTNLPGSWVELDVLPSKAELQDKIDEIEIKALGTKRGKKVTP